MNHWVLMYTNLDLKRIAICIIYTNSTVTFKYMALTILIVHSSSPSFLIANLITSLGTQSDPFEINKREIEWEFPLHFIDHNLFIKNSQHAQQPRDTGWATWDHDNYYYPMHRGKDKLLIKLSSQSVGIWFSKIILYWWDQQAAVERVHQKPLAFQQWCQKDLLLCQILFCWQRLTPYQW